MVQNYMNNTISIDVSDIIFLSHEFLDWKYIAHLQQLQSKIRYFVDWTKNQRCQLQFVWMNELNLASSPTPLPSVACEIDNFVNTPLPAGAMCYPSIIEYALNWQTGVMGYYTYNNKMAFHWFIWQESSD